MGARMAQMECAKTMKLEDQISMFRRDLEALCERYAVEFDLPIEAAIGVLQCAIIQAYANATK